MKLGLSKQSNMTLSNEDDACETRQVVLVQLAKLNVRASDKFIPCVLQRRVKILISLTETILRQQNFW